MTNRRRPPYEPTDKDRRIVEMLAGWAITEERIANVVGIDPKTLRKHYRNELDVGHSKLEAQLAQNLLRIAQGHDRQALIATIFALKASSGGSKRHLRQRSPRSARRKRLSSGQRVLARVRAGAGT